MWGVTLYTTISIVAWQKKGKQVFVYTNAYAAQREAATLQTRSRTPVHLQQTATVTFAARALFNDRSSAFFMCSLRTCLAVGYKTRSDSARHAMLYPYPRDNAYLYGFEI